MDPADGNDLTRVVRTSSRNRNAVKRDRQPFVKLEPTFSHGYGEEDGEDEGEDENENEGKMSYGRDDDDDVVRGIDQDGASGSGVGEMKGYHLDGETGAYDTVKPVSVAKAARGGSKPARTTKRRDSTVKRKEQNRIAQRAFRIRKKVYHLELESNAIEAADKIQDMADSNTKLMRMMERLQRENTALKANQATTDLSNKTVSSQRNLDGPTKPVKRKDRAARPSYERGQSLADAMLPINEVEPDLTDDPLVSLDDLEAGRNGLKGKAQSVAQSPEAYQTRWTDPAPPQSTTVPPWVQDHQMYTPFTTTTRPTTASTSYAPDSRSSLSSPVAYVHNLPCHPGGGQGESSRPSTANAKEQHIEIINNPTFVYHSDFTSPQNDALQHQHRGPGSVDLLPRAPYPTNFVPSYPDMTGMYRDQQQEAVRADSVRRYSRALQQHYHPRLPLTGDDGCVRAELPFAQPGHVGNRVDRSQVGPFALSIHHPTSGAPDVWAGSLHPPVQGSTYVMPLGPDVGQSPGPLPSWPGHVDTYQNHINSNDMMMGGFHSALKPDAQGSGMMPVGGALTPVDGLGTMDWSARLDWRKTTATWPDTNGLDMSRGQQSSGTSTHSTGMVSDALGGGGTYMSR